jgi:hypothetical protein
MPLKSLENLLDQGDGGDLGRLVRRAREMDSLVQSLQQALGGDAGASISAANLRDDGTLVVLSSSSAWAARLRFETETLLEAARNAGVKADACKIRVSSKS